MDAYTQAVIKTHVHVDAGQRVWFRGQQLEVHLLGGEKKVVLPGGKITYTFDDLKRAGAKVDVVTLRSLAQQGAEGRWKENIEARRKDGLPSNVYIANARTIQLAIAAGKAPPDMRFVGRKRDRITETYATVDEVVTAMASDKWRTEFARGGKAKRKTK